MAMIPQTSKYNHVFKNVIPNSIEGIKIFGVNDDYENHRNMNRLLILKIKSGQSYFRILSQP